MAGTSIIFPDANPSQADVIATLWTPEGIAPNLVTELVLGVSGQASVLNHAAPETPGSIFGAPTYAPHSIIAAQGTNSGIDTGMPASESDQTFLIVIKGFSGGSIFASTNQFTGLLYAVSNNTWGFYNSQGGVAPDVAEAPPVSGNGFQFVIGWGSQGGKGNIQTGSGGALSATVTGNADGDVRPTANVKLGGTAYGNAGFECAFAARVPAILTPAQRLAWYNCLRGDGTAAGSPLGVAVA